MYKMVLASVISISSACGSNALAEGTKTGIAFDGACNEAVVIFTKPKVAYRETEPRSCENVIGNGFEASTIVKKIKGKWFIIGALNANYPAEEDTEVLQYPLTTGGQWFSIQPAMAKI